MKTNVFLIAGDPLLRSQKAKAAVSEIEKKSGVPFSHQVFNLDETSLDAVLTAARTLPFFSSGQVLYARGAELLKEADLKLLENYLAHPAPQTVLVLESDALKETSELAKVVRAGGQSIFVAKDEARGAGAAFLQQKLARYAKTMVPAARARVLAMCGEAYMFLDTMLERLAQFAGDQKEIDEAMVDRFEEHWAELDVFKLTNALVDRDAGRALKVFRDLREFNDADFYSVIGILHWQLRQLWQASKLLADGVPEREIASKLRMPPSRFQALRRFPAGRLEAAIEALYQLDKKSKTGMVDGNAGLEAWLLEYA